MVLFCLRLWMEIWKKEEKRKGKKCRSIWKICQKNIWIIHNYYYIEYILYFIYCIKSFYPVEIISNIVRYDKRPEPVNHSKNNVELFKFLFFFFYMGTICLSNIEMLGYDVHSPMSMCDNVRQHFCVSLHTIFIINFNPNQQ